MSDEKAVDASELLCNGEVPLEMRLTLMENLIHSDHPQGKDSLRKVLQRVAETPEKCQQLALALGVKLRDLDAGSMGQAVFLQLVEHDHWGRRAEVRIRDGSHQLCLVPDDALADTLRQGDIVWLEPQGHALLSRQSPAFFAGEEVRLERQIDDAAVEVVHADQDRLILTPSANLVEQLRSGEAKPGDRLLISRSLGVALRGIPSPEGLSHFQFLAREPVPQVDPDRDIGDPPQVISVFTEHLRRELFHPEVARHYGIRPCLSMVLYGVSGTGKTLALQGCWFRMYQLMSERTGVPVADLPHRVVRVKPSKVLSMYFGESDRLIDLLFDEIEELATTPYRTPGGCDVILPLLVLMEEMDALTRSRGRDMDGIYDRVQSTLLQRWDVTSSHKLRESPVIFACTTNVVKQIDIAALRRAGAWMEKFSHLSQKGFLQVLTKHLDGRPVQDEKGQTTPKARERVIQSITEQLFELPPVLSLIMEGWEREPVEKAPKDFMTGGLIDRAVQTALRRACHEQEHGASINGITPRHLAVALTEQVSHVVDQLDRHNVTDFLALPDGLRVAEVRKAVVGS